MPGLPTVVNEPVIALCGARRAIYFPVPTVVNVPTIVSGRR